MAAQNRSRAPYGSGLTLRRLGRCFSAGAQAVGADFLIHTRPGYRLGSGGPKRGSDWQVELPNNIMSWIDTLQSANWHQASRFCLLAYVLGCFTAGYYLVRWLAEKDIRDIGSGSVGARNVGRVLGKTGFFLTVLFDFGKGAVAVLVARHFTGDDRLAGVAMLAVVAGHIWPAQLRFHGGKGMATSLGALLAYDPQLAGTFAVIFLCLCLVLRKLVVPGLLAMGCLPLAGMLLSHAPVKVLLVSVLAGLVIVGHRKNLMEAFGHWAARRELEPKPDESQL
jgi:glycerol-3-phosphate acyltransferase PlsY